MTKILRDTLIIIIITLAILAALEAILRAAYPDKIDNKNLLSSIAFKHDDAFLITLKPNIEKQFEVGDDNGGGIVTWKTNSLGFRGEEIGSKSGPRIIVYGDSNIHARFTHSAMTYTSVLQSIIRTRHTNAEVINAGMVGAGPDQSLIRLTRDIDIIESDIVIFHVFADNDYGDILRNRLFEISSDGRLVRTKHPVTKDQEITSREPTLINKINTMLLVRAALKLVSNETSPDTLDINEKAELTMRNLELQSEVEFDIYKQNRPRQISHFADHYDIDIATNPASESSRTKIQLMENILVEADKLLQSRHISFLVVIQPSVFDLTLNKNLFGYQHLEKYKDYKQDNLTKPLKHICDKHNLNCIHLIDSFVQHKPDTLYRNNDNHWSDKGQQLAAEATATMVQTLLD